MDELTGKVLNLIHQELKNRIEKKSSAIEEDVVRNIRRIVRSEVANVALSLHSFVSVSTLGNDLVITIKDHREKKETSDSRP